MVTIRKAQIQDARRISYLIQRNTEMVKENFYSEAQILVWKKANTPSSIVQQMQKSQFFCAFQAKQLVACIGIRNQEIFGFYVSYSKRGKGIGHLLFDHLLNWAKTKKETQLYLYTSPSAKNFYLKMKTIGFE